MEVPLIAILAPAAACFSLFGEIEPLAGHVLIGLGVWLG
jgi:hypothetical protein